MSSTIRAVSIFSSKGERPGQEDHVLTQEEKGLFAGIQGSVNNGIDIMLKLEHADIKHAPRAAG